MERNIEVVYVRPKRLRVMAFSIAENTVDVSVLLNDGKDKELSWKSRVTEPKLMAAKMLGELMALEEGEFTDFDGETLTNNPIVLLHEKAKTEAAMVDFFQTVYSKARMIRNQTRSEGYLNRVADLRRTELVF